MPALNRRQLIVSTLAGTTTGSLIRTASIAAEPAAWSLPIAFPDRPAGDGFWIRHGYACENTWYFPGAWHTGEDWYALGGDTAGALVLAVADGTVVFAGSDYPGRVMIIEHRPQLFSMYGHLAFEPLVEQGSEVHAGQPLGYVLPRDDGRAPSHLHFEIRTFLTTPEVNGEAPRYGFGCGVQCPPGPGYWPIDAPEHPSAMGWRNPTHVIGSQRGTPFQAEATADAPAGTDVWQELPQNDGLPPDDTLSVAPGSRYRVEETAAGATDSQQTSALAYWLWYRIEIPDRGPVWVRAAVPSDEETGQDGRPSSVRLLFVPVTRND